jgi:hypothetical protein
MVEACRLGERDTSASSAPPRENIFFVRCAHRSPAAPSLPLPVGEERGLVTEQQEHRGVDRYARVAFAEISVK